jgi:hypothetical protein
MPRTHLNPPGALNADPDPPPDQGPKVPKDPQKADTLEGPPIKPPTEPRS